MKPERLRRGDPVGPVIADMDFGHTTPIFTLPIGCRARIDGDAHQFSITEATVL